MSSADEGLAAVNRAIFYASQLAAVGVDGLLGTFLPLDVPHAPPAESREWTEPSDGTTIA